MQNPVGFVKFQRIFSGKFWFFGCFW